METTEVPCPPGARLHFSWHLTNSLYILPVTGEAGRVLDERPVATALSWCGPAPQLGVMWRSIVAALH